MIQPIEGWLIAGDDDINDLFELQVGLISIFLKQTFQINETLSPWISLGISKFTEDLEDLDIMNEYGYGIDVNLNNKLTFGIGLLSCEKAGKILQETIVDIYGKEKIEFERMVISIGYSL